MALFKGEDCIIFTLSNVLTNAMETMLLLPHTPK